MSSAVRTGVFAASDPTFRRRIGACGSSADRDVAFDTVVVESAAASPQTVTARTSTVGNEATCPLDTFLAVYQPSFNPASSTQSCVTSNDDTNGPCSRASFTLAPGTSATIVVQPFSGPSRGEQWQLNLSSTGSFRVLP